MKKEDPIIETINLSKSYGGIKALDKVDVEIYEGELLYIVGDNGAGKSTFIHLLSGAITKDYGSEVFYKGEKARLSSPRKAIELGIYTVYQDLSLCNNLNAFQNIYLGRELTSFGRLDTGTMEGNTINLFNTLGSNVPDLSVPVELRSGGQRQAIAIARTMLVPPRVVLMDEPTAALGVTQRKQVLDLTRRLRDDGIAVVVVSQDLDEVVESADRVIVFRFGTVEKIFTKGTFTRDDLVASITGLGE